MTDKISVNSATKLSEAIESMEEKLSADRGVQVVITGVSRIEAGEGRP